MVMAVLLLGMALISASGGAPSSDAISSNSRQANGFIYLQLQPPVLRVRPGEVTTGRINITIHEAAEVDTAGSPWIIKVRPCCTEPEVAELIEAPEVAVRLEHIRSTVFSFLVSVRGVRMGRTTIRFFVTKNCSTSADEGVASEVQLHLCSAHSDEDRGPMERSQEEDFALRRRTPEEGSGQLRGVQRRDVGQVKGQNEEVAALNSLPNETSRQSPHHFVFLNWTALRVDDEGVSYNRPGQTSGASGAPSELERLRGSQQTSEPGSSSFTNKSGISGSSQLVVGPIHLPFPRGSKLDNYTIDPSYAQFSVPALHNASEPVVEVWWIPQEYHVIVCRPVERSTVVWVNYLLMAFIAVNLVGIGGQVDWTEVLVLLRRPSTLALGLFARFAILPVFGLILVELFHPSDLVTLGSLIILCTPTDGVSCLLILLVDGDLTLSILLATVNNFAAFGLLPLWGILFEKTLHSESKHLQMPLRPMIAIFCLMTLSLAVGHVLHRRLPRPYFKFWLLLPSFTLLTVLLVLLFEIYSAYYLFELIQPRILVLTVGLVGAGYSSGALVAYLARRSHSRALIIFVETGVRTTHVVGHVLTTSLPEPDSDFAHAPATLYAVLCLLPAVAMATVYRIVYKYRLSVYAETECKMMEDGGMGDDLEELCPRSGSASAASAAAAAAAAEEAAASSPNETTTAI